MPRERGFEGTNQDLLTVLHEERIAPVSENDNDCPAAEPSLARMRTGRVVATAIDCVPALISSA